MPVNPLKEVFNRLLWVLKDDLADYVIVFVHRGAEEDRRTINAKQLRHVGKSWFRYESETEGDTIIPFHRVIEVRNKKTNEILWRSQKHG